MDRNVDILKVLADKSRYQILDLLLKNDLCVGALSGHLGISKAAISQHLQILRKAGLVRGEKRGYWTHYSVEKGILYQLADDLRKMADQPPSHENVCFRMYPEANKLCGKEEGKMCKGPCEHPEKLQGKPGECTPEQIKECHGDTKEHPCKEEKK